MTLARWLFRQREKRAHHRSAKSEPKMFHFDVVVLYSHRMVITPLGQSLVGNVCLELYTSRVNCARSAARENAIQRVVLHYRYKLCGEIMLCAYLSN